MPSRNTAQADPTATQEAGGNATKDVAPHAYPSWEQFEKNLEHVLGRLPVEHFLIVSTRLAGEGDEPYFIQFAQGGLSGFLAEAVSNRFLKGAKALSPAQEQQMAVIGWMWPTPGSETEPNFSRQWPIGTPFHEVARLAVRTLQEIYGVAQPADLLYQAFSKGGPHYAQAALGIDPEPPSQAATPAEPGLATVEQLKPLVEAAIKGFCGDGEIQYDKDGDVPIRTGSAMVFLRLHDGKPPMVGIFAPVLWGIEESPELLTVINSVNSQIKFGRAFWTGKEVMVATEVPAIGVTAGAIGFAAFQVGSLADNLDDELQKQFGGKTMFGTPVAPVDPSSEHRPIGFAPPPK